MGGQLVVAIMLALVAVLAGSLFVLQHRRRREGRWASSPPPGTGAPWPPPGSWRPGVAVVTYLVCWGLVWLGLGVWWLASSPDAPRPCEGLCWSPRESVVLVAWLVALVSLAGHVLGALVLRLLGVRVAAVGHPASRRVAVGLLAFVVALVTPYLVASAWTAAGP